MKKLLLLLLFLPCIALGQSLELPGRSQNRYTNSSASEDVKGGTSFYIINTIACRKENDAVNSTQKLINEGYRAGYLWIPDYNSLSGKEYYTVYIGPFYSQYECEVEVEKYRKIQPTAYGLIVNQGNKRVVITGVGKVRVTSY